MNEATLVGIDLGTSSVKAVVVDPRGTRLGVGSAEYPIHSPQPDRAEQEPEAWVQAAATAVRQARAQSGPRPVAAIGLSGQMHGTVLLGDNQQPLAPAVIWPDQRSRRQVQEITALVGQEQLIETTGSPVATGFMAATLRWFQREEPELWRHTRCALLPKDYLRLRLTGELATDPSDGSGALLLDVRRRDWADELLDLLGIGRGQLPPVQPSASVAGWLREEAAALFDLPAGAPVVTGGADTACSLLGAGATTPGALLLTLSTGGQLVLPTAAVEVDRKGRIHTFCSAAEERTGQAAWYQMGAILAAGLALRWLRDSVFGLAGPDAYAQITAWAEEAPPGSDGLLFLPYLVGERTPHMDPSARGMFYGLTLRHGRPALARAVLEGISFACYDAFCVLAELGAAPERVLLAGGGAQSRLWQQIISDVFGAPVQRLLVTEQSALGAALLAGDGAGLFDLSSAAGEWVQTGSLLEPDLVNNARYSERFEAFRDVYQRNKGHFGP